MQDGISGPRPLWVQMIGAEPASPAGQGLVLKRQPSCDPKTATSVGSSLLLLTQTASLGAVCVVLARPWPPVSRWVIETQKVRPGPGLPHCQKWDRAEPWTPPDVALAAATRPEVVPGDTEEWERKAPPVWSVLMGTGGYHNSDLLSHLPVLLHILPAPPPQRTGPHFRPESQQILCGLFGNCFCF